MKKRIPATFAVFSVLCASSPAKKAVVEEPPAPVSHLTLGTQFSEDLAGGSVGGLFEMWMPAKRDALLFLDAGYHYEDNGQSITSLGLGFRKLLPGDKVIVGANVFWDHVHSENDNDLDQLGFGFEVLTQWVDVRFNYYIPEDDRFEIGHRTASRTRTGLAPGGITRTTTRDEFTTFETGLEGFNAEIGFLIPGTEKFAETRIFAGYYHYENPHGSDFDGFKARLEARILQGVTAEVEYWDDKALMGGHWTAGISVSVPFSIGNLFTGKNPFEGAGESFKRVPRRFADRLGDKVERSHRIQTTTSGDIRTGSSTSKKFTPLPASPPLPPGKPPGGGFPVE